MCIFILIQLSLHGKVMPVYITLFVIHVHSKMQIPALLLIKICNLSLSLTRKHKTHTVYGCPCNFKMIEMAVTHLQQLNVFKCQNSVYNLCGHTSSFSIARIFQVVVIPYLIYKILKQKKLIMNFYLVILYTHYHTHLQTLVMSAPE